MGNPGDDETMRRNHPMRGRRPRPLARLAAVAIAAGTLLVTVGCGGDKARWYSADGRPAAEEPVAPAVNIAVTGPVDGAADVPASTEIAYTTDAASTTVELTDAAGTRVDGSLRPDSSTWVPAQMLNWATQYTAKVTGTSAAGKSESRTVTFTTMAKPKSTAKASSVIGDGQVVGVGMPVIIHFSSDVAKDQRANVQNRLFVTSSPPQEGIWHWWSSREVHFRPKEYWQAGTKLSVRAAIGGLLLGNNRYGAADLVLNASVGSKIVMVADNANKHMTVTKDGQVLRTIPVSFGKASSPSASGHFIIMIKNTWEWFDSASFGVPSDSPDGYRIKVYYPQRLTWDGEYIHSAPWSEKDQGKRNVSHGCTNVSAANAEWLYKLTQIGDPVIIKGTEQHVKWQNGWTDWDRPWAEYVKGSAIPYTPPPAPPSVGPSVESSSSSASPSASPATSAS
jgi:lipoprotein-anchoring transpeptidase ErfK/SrfK